MKKFFKKASIYLIIMFLAAAVIFSLNYYYGKQISEDIESEISQFAEQNNYKLNSIEVNSNPLLEKIEFNNLNLTADNNFNLKIENAVINFSWQQIISYIRGNDLNIDENFKSRIKTINYRNLKNDYSLNFTDSDINYTGQVSEAKLNQINSSSDLYLLMEDNHNFEFKAAEIKYDFPYHRSYGLNKENWDKLSYFNNLVFRADYNKDSQILDIKEFNLSSEFITVLFNLNSKIKYDDQQQKILYESLKGDYDFYFTAENLNFESTSYFNDLKFKQLDLNGSLNLNRENEEVKTEQLDFNLNLNSLELLLTESTSQKLKENTFGILAKDDKFNLIVDKFSYQQNYSYPSGSSSSNLDSNILLAETKAEYSLSEEVPYISSAQLKFKTQKSDIKELNLLLQILLSQSFTKDEDGFYVVEFWGSIDDLNFE